MENTEVKVERVLIVGVDIESKRDRIEIESSMNELEELVNAAGGEVVGELVQKRSKPDGVTYVGKGKLEEIRLASEELEVDTIVFNNELSGSQLRNIERVVDKKILDRTSLILDIFANRATSSEGKLQVELAQLKYRLPRLIGFGNYLSRQGGGIGTRGPGEQKLEVDRRHIMKKVSEIEKQLKALGTVREVKRKRRSESNMPIVAIVGYTNAGKSTLLNTIIRDDEDYDVSKDVFTKDMLFATLETSLRKGSLPSGRELLVTDTVGFVSDLPTKLVEAFKGTLEEVKYADVILHVVDITNEDIEIQMRTTLDLLKDLKVLDKPMINVLNKCDRIEDRDIGYGIEEPKVMISAKTGENIDTLLSIIEENIPDKFKKTLFKIPYDEYSVVANIFGDKGVESMEYDEDGIRIVALVGEEVRNRLSRYIETDGEVDEYNEEV